MAADYSGRLKAMVYLSKSDVSIFVNNLGEFEFSVIFLSKEGRIIAEAYLLVLLK